MAAEVYSYSTRRFGTTDRIGLPIIQPMLPWPPTGGWDESGEGSPEMRRSWRLMDGPRYMPGLTGEHPLPTQCL